MARRTNEHPPQRQNSSIRVRFLELELSGSDAAIEEALRALERVRRPAIDVPAAANRIPHNGIPANGSSSLRDDATLFDDVVEADAATAITEPAPVAPEEVTPGSEAPRRKRGEGDRIDRNAGIKPEGDIDFVPNGKQPLKEFFAGKAPTSDMDQILVICHFLQHILQANRIGPGHILSGFKHVGEPIPKDLKQTIRNMKNKAWLNFTSIDDIRLTTVGDNRVEHELGNGNTGARAK
jgi:hypothetical protein